MKEKMNEIVEDYIQHFGEASGVKENLMELADTVWNQASTQSMPKIEEVDLEVLQTLVRDLDKALTHGYTTQNLNHLLPYCHKLDKIKKYIGVIE